ncbi:MAG: beta-galactosidase [Firmicutes bacterium]|nr:beta-galactosidase [Bacillota bacterium]
MRTVVFCDPSFPIEGSLPNEKQLAVHWPSATVCTAQALRETLLCEDVSCLVTLHGPYFPKDAWPAILAFLQRGGGWVHVGGAPFKIPVTGEPGHWSHSGEETAYHQQLYIHEALAASVQEVVSLAVNEDLPIGVGWEEVMPVAPTYGLILTPAQRPDHPEQMGSASTMDTRIYPLIRGLCAQGRHRTSPAVLLEHYRGAFAGGRWVLVNQAMDHRFDTETGILLLAKTAAYCQRGVTEVWIKPQYATYLPGEQASLTFQWEKIARNGDGSWQTEDERQTYTWSVHMAVSRVGQTVWEQSMRVTAEDYLQVQTFQVPVAVQPGLYEVTCTIAAGTLDKRTLRQGYWGRDESLLVKGDYLRAERDYFMRGDKPMPVVGMTYMTSDVGRKFLTLPNVHVWHEDMAQLQAAGVNLIRTGMWTAWRHLMLEDGHASETVLRAIDAFILTARAHGLEVTFTFFSFTPEAWEGANPYLDPRSVQAQKRFIASIVSRFAGAKGIHWDLINEPSLFDPKRPFAGPRSLGDVHERAAWVKWLQERHPSLSALQHHWNMTPAELPSYEAAALPVHEDINSDVEDLSVLKRGTRWLDYTRFTMDMHNQWVRALSAVIHALAPHQLITVGQDEALGLGPRPSPFFYASAVDYTTVHTWWLNDQLVWDGVFGKALDRPNLIQETGIMYLETPDNRAKRTEEELRNILERKYAYAFATGGAGAVQWIWNTNYFMASVNESNIGALRADGSQKPEAQVSYDFGRFIQEVQDLFRERQREEVAIVFPYSNDFSNRRFAVDATARAVRVLSYDQKTPVRGLSEYHLEEALTEQMRPKVVIIPSAHNFSDEARRQLLAYVEDGGTLLWTGPLAQDAYWRESDAGTAFFGPVRLANVAREESLVVGGVPYAVSFGARRIAQVNKEMLDASDESGITHLHERGIGKGRLYWCPLPIELAEQTAVSAAVYAYVMRQVGVTPWIQWCKGQEHRGVYGGKLPFAHGALYVFVSEQSAPVDVEIKDTVTGRQYAFTLASQRSVLFAVQEDGKVLASYRQVPITVS